MEAEAKIACPYDYCVDARYKDEKVQPGPVHLQRLVLLTDWQGVYQNE